MRYVTFQVKSQVGLREVQYNQKGFLELTQMSVLAG